MANYYFKSIENKMQKIGTGIAICMLLIFYSQGAFAQLSGYAGTLGITWDPNYSAFGTPIQTGPKINSMTSLNFYHFTTGENVFLNVSGSFTNTRYTTNFPNTAPETGTNASLPDLGLEFGSSTLDNQASKKFKLVDRMAPMTTVGSPDPSYYNPGDASLMNLTQMRAFNILASTEGLNVDGSSTNGRYLFGTLTMTFSRPVDYPIMHVTGLGGFFIGTTIDPVKQFLLAYSTDLESTTYNLTRMNGTASTKASLLPDNKTITSTYTYDPGSLSYGAAGTEAGTGSFRIEGTNITSVTFNVYIKGKPTLDAISGNPIEAHSRWSSYDGYPTGSTGPNFNGIQSYAGDQFSIAWTLPSYDVSGLVIVDNTANNPGTISSTGGTGEGPYTGSTASTPLYAILITKDASNNDVVVQSVQVEADGTFVFPNVISDSYRVIISKDAGTVGSAPPSASAPTGYFPNGQYFGSTNTTPPSDGSPADNSTIVYGVDYNNVSATITPTLIFGISTNHVLPVSLKSFTAEAKDCAVGLKWASAIESNFAGYEIERSQNGTLFTKLATVSTRGSNSSYAYTDGTAPKGTNYYRLKMIDKDGKFAYSTIEKVTSICTMGFIKLEPTLTTQSTILKGLSGTEVIRVYSAIGQMVISKRAINVQEEIDLGGFVPGAYNVVVTVGGQPIFTGKVVKQ